MKRLHSDKINNKLEEYMGERGPDAKPVPKVQAAFMDDDLKKEIDRIINQQVEEQMKTQGKGLVTQIVREKSLDFKSKNMRDKIVKEDY